MQKTLLFLMLTLIMSACASHNQPETIPVSSERSLESVPTAEYFPQIDPQKLFGKRNP